MSVTIPAVPRPLSSEPELREFGSVKTPPGGGSDLSVAEIGDRWKIRFTYPAMDANCARKFIAAQLRAKTEPTTVRAVLRVTGDTPSGVVATGSVNSTLISVNDTDGIELGMPFSFEGGGRAYLHFVTGISGALVSVGPRLRFGIENVALNFAEPTVEGLLVDTPLNWKVEKLATSGIGFTISENK